MHFKIYVLCICFNIAWSATHIRLPRSGITSKRNTDISSYGYSNNDDEFKEKLPKTNRDITDDSLQSSYSKHHFNQESENSDSKSESVFDSKRRSQSEDSEQSHRGKRRKPQPQANFETDVLDGSRRHDENIKYGRVSQNDTAEIVNGIKPPRSEQREKVLINEDKEVSDKNESSLVNTLVGRRNYQPLVSSPDTYQESKEEDLKRLGSKENTNEFHPNHKDNSSDVIGLNEESIIAELSKHSEDTSNNTLKYIKIINRENFFDNVSEVLSVIDDLIEKQRNAQEIEGRRQNKDDEADADLTDTKTDTEMDTTTTGPWTVTSTTERCKSQLGHVACCLKCCKRSDLGCN